MSSRLPVWLFVLAVGGACRPAEPTDVEILWDRWGVPHVYAQDEAGLFRGFGWAQMHSHGDVLLELIGQARGEAAALWGEAYLDSDRWVRTMGIRERARRWFEQQPDGFAAKLDAFAAGVNAYAAEHRDRIADAVEPVLPVRGVDLLAHLQRVVHFSIVCNEGFVGGAAGALEQGGSNAWVVAPERSASGHALLLANPHMPWSDRFRFYEAQLECPTYRAYGATFVGFPTLAIAFNDHLGWTHTMNTHDGVDLFQLELEGDGYVWDGDRRSFERSVHTLRVGRGGGGQDERELVVRSSLHGPVIASTDRRALALRCVGLDRPGAFHQWWRMGAARDLEEFEAALRLMQVPTFTVLYADAAGNVLHLFGGLTPVRRDEALDWSRPVAGSRSETLWDTYHDYAELPRVLNPRSGWLQNANDPPWTTTFPVALDPDDYPAYLAPRGMSFRAQSAASLLIGGASVALDDLILHKHSTHAEIADRMLEDLLPAARASGDPRLRRVAEALSRWDRSLDASSRGALLFLRVVQALGDEQDVFAEGWDAARPTATPTGLADPARVVAALERAVAQLEDLDELERPWGEVFRLRAGEHDLPCSGGMGALGVLRAFEFQPDADGRMRVVGGDGFVAAVEFSDPPRARVLTIYGNASQPGSRHVGDQIPLAARGELREAWLTRAAVEGELEVREWVPRARLNEPADRDPIAGEGVH